jgi:hypothetical protein
VHPRRRSASVSSSLVVELGLMLMSRDVIVDVAHGRACVVALALPREVLVVVRLSLLREFLSNGRHGLVAWAPSAVGVVRGIVPGVAGVHGRDGMGVAAAALPVEVGAVARVHVGAGGGLTCGGCDNEARGVLSPLYRMDRGGCADVCACVRGYRARLVERPVRGSRPDANRWMRSCGNERASVCLWSAPSVGSHRQNVDFF